MRNQLVGVLLFSMMMSAAAQESSRAMPGTTITVTSNLVMVDVVVRDKSGHVVHGLKQSDFALLENKVPQTLRNFEETNSADTVSSALPAALPAGTFTNFAPSTNGPLNILLFDKYDTKLTDQGNLRNQMLKFIDEAKPGTRLAIFDLGDRIRLMQGFTDDKALLRAALKDNDPTKVAPFETNSAVPGDSANSTHGRMQGGLDAAVGNPRPSSGDGMSHPTPAGDMRCELARTRSRVMRSTMEFLALYLGNLPGRKNLLWYSDRFPLNLFASDDMARSCFEMSDDFRHTVDKLISNQVSIYPVDISDTLPVKEDQLDELAEETGGRAYYKSNALDEVTLDALDDGANYYSLAYAPSNTNWDNGYRKIEVRLTNGMQAELSYRQGYYATDPNKAVKSTLFGRPEKPTAVERPDAMHLAMMQGLPNATQVIMTTKVSAGEATESALAAGNEGSKDFKAPYRRFTIGYDVDAKTLDFKSGSDGLQHGAVELIVLLYDQKSMVVNAVGSTAHVDVRPEVYGAILNRGLNLKQEISVPAKGEYTLRIAVHDLMNDHVGTIEVPTSAAGH